MAVTVLNRRYGALRSSFKALCGYAAPNYKAWSSPTLNA
jgi:hypothetical protein